MDSVNIPLYNVGKLSNLPGVIQLASVRAEVLFFSDGLLLCYSLTYIMG